MLSELLVRLLVERAIVHSSRDPLAHWPCSATFMPDAKANAITIYDTTPVTLGRVLQSGKTYKLDGFQVSVRSVDYVLGYRKIAEIFDFLSSNRLLDVGRYTLNSILPDPPAFAGREPETRRSLFTCNGVAYVTQR